MFKTDLLIKMLFIYVKLHLNTSALHSLFQEKIHRKSRRHKTTYLTLESLTCIFVCLFQILYWLSQHICCMYFYTKIIPRKKLWIIQILKMLCVCVEVSCKESCTYVIICCSTLIRKDKAPSSYSFSITLSGLCKIPNNACVGRTVVDFVKHSI